MFTYCWIVKFVKTWSPLSAWIFASLFFHQGTVLYYFGTLHSLHQWISQFYMTFEINVKTSLTRKPTNCSCQLFLVNFMKPCSILFTLKFKTDSPQVLRVRRESFKLLSDIHQKNHSLNDLRLLLKLHSKVYECFVYTTAQRPMHDTSICHGCLWFKNLSIHAKRKIRAICWDWSTVL